MAFRWLNWLWETIDGLLRSISMAARKIVRTLRILRAFLVVGLLLVIGAVVGAFIQPEWMPLWFAIAVVFLVIPLIIITALVAAPLQAKSVVRLVDMGYPANAREMGIRIVARKLHEESIETEELLVDTALNEARKAVRRYRRAAERLAEEADRMDDGPDEVIRPPARCKGTTRDGDRCRRQATHGDYCSTHKP